MESTSVIAHDRIESTGKAGAHRNLVRAVLAAHDGLTAGEVGQLSGLPSEEAGRRLSDLEDMGECYADQKRRRRCSVKGSSMQTWWRGERPTTQRELF